MNKSMDSAHMNINIDSAHMNVQVTIDSAHLKFNIKTFSILCHNHYNFSGLV